MVIGCILITMVIFGLGVFVGFIYSNQQDEILKKGKKDE